MKQKIKACLADFVYGLYEKKIVKNQIQVMSIDETLDELLGSNKSLVRFGDGEIVMIDGKSLAFQKESEELSKRLSDILQYKEENMMVAIPDIFDGLSQYRTSGQAFWKDHLLFFRKVYKKNCNTKKKYGNAYVSRCYYNYADKQNAQGWFLKFRRLWENKKVVVVEGMGTHNGVGNDLLDNALEVKRILCPSENAVDFLKEIEEVCLAQTEDSLYLLSLGPTAKLLAEDLFHAGRRVIDIGNLDMEYEWFLQKAIEKTKLEKHKIVGEAANKEKGYTKYLDQVITWIG